MTKKCRARLWIPGLARHVFVILLSSVVQPSCCAKSLLCHCHPGLNIFGEKKMVQGLQSKIVLKKTVLIYACYVWLESFKL